MTAAGSVGLVLPGCGVPTEQRQFLVSEVFRWQPANIVRDVAFAVLGDSVLDYVDTLCQDCGRGVRFFLFAADVASTVATVACPSCSVAARLGVAVSRVLFSQMRSYAFSKAIAVLAGAAGSYVVNKVGPLQRGRAAYAVARSAICYRISDHEPVDIFDRQIAAIPDRICYFTDVAGARGQRVTHVWRCNGQVTDRIPLPVDGDRWRTYSRKRNLARGAWIVTSELAGGEILDSREFHIA